MAKRKKKAAKKTSTIAAKNQKSKTSRRLNLKKILGTVVGLFLFFALGSVGISAYQKNWEIAHDLSAIGNGVPTIVQIHDPKCPKCKKLMSNTKTALRDYKDEIEFKIADITTSAGKRLQREHGAQTISLLMFDRKGKLRRSINGVKSADVLEVEIDDFLKRASR